MQKRQLLSKSNVFTGVVVVGFATLVIFALVYTGMLSGTQSTELSFQQLTLYGGSASVHSYTAACSGDALLELYAQNPTSNPVNISTITIYASGGNATVYISLSNGCLTLQESGVSVPANGDYKLEGYVSQPLAFASTYRCVITFSNGQELNQSLIAQS